MSMSAPRSVRESAQTEVLVEAISAGFDLLNRPVAAGVRAATDAVSRSLNHFGEILQARRISPATENTVFGRNFNSQVVDLSKQGRVSDIANGFYQGEGVDLAVEVSGVFGGESGILNKVDINPEKTIAGRKIINSDLAGKKVKTKGGEVWFDYDGFPDFTSYSIKTVRVKGLTGDMANDVPLAMKRAGITSYDKTKYVWHHHQDARTMMLVPRSVHSVRNGGVAHTGGRAVIQHNLYNPQNLLNYLSPEEKF